MNDLLGAVKWRQEAGAWRHVFPGEAGGEEECGGLAGKDALDVLDSENTANRVKKGCGEGTSHDRTRQAITNSLKKKLRDLLGEFNVLRTQIQEEYRDVVSRHYSAINGTP
eukprot:gene2736-3514_t